LTGIARHQAVFRGLPEQLLGRTAKQRRRGGIGLDHAQLVIHHQHAQRRGINQLAQQLLAFLQGGLTRLQLHHHLVEGCRQLANLVCPVDIRRLLQLATGKAPCSLFQARQAAGYQAAVQVIEQ